MQGEEPDLCARLLRNGFVTTLGRADPAIHHVSTKRQRELITHYATRNQFLIPIRYGSGAGLALQMAARSAFSAGRIWRSRHPRAVLQGAGEGISLSRAPGQRDPLPKPLYRLLMRLEAERLAGRPRTRLEDVEELLPQRPTLPSADAERAGGQADAAAPPASPSSRAATSPETGSAP